MDGGGLSSYPHPWLMPDFWQFPTVSMGLGPIMAIYQARFLKYLQDRGLADTASRKVWAFLGDGEIDEPESLGAISLAGREKLDNLIFVINCNLQRLDGPVRGNGKIIQELEAIFRGAGWNVIKVIWGTGWDPLLAKDTDGILLKRMEECVDGEYQDFKSKNGAYVREHFFGKYPELKAMVADMGDERHLEPRPRRPRPAEGLRRLRGGGGAQGRSRPSSSPRPSRATAWARPARGRTSPTSRRRWARRTSRSSATASALPLADDQLKDVPFLRFEEGSPEMTYLRERRARPGRPPAGAAAQVASRSRCRRSRRSTPSSRAPGGATISTTMAFVRILNTLLRDKKIGKRVVPIVPDESPHLRHGGHVPPVRHLQPGRPALPAGGRQPADVLQGGQERADPAGGHQRAGRHVLLDRGGDVLQHRRTRR